MDAAIFIGVSAVISLGVFLNGWRFARLTSNPFAGMKLFGRPIEGSELSVEQLNRMGRLHMMAAPAILLLFAIVAMQV